MESESLSKTPAADAAYAYIRKFNDSAALCIEIEEYDRAISSLTKALRIARSVIEKKQQLRTDQSSKDNGSGCGCRHCSLDGYIRFSEDRRHIHPLLQNKKDNGEREDAFADNRNEASIRQRFLLRRHRRRQGRGEPLVGSSSNSNTGYSSNAGGDDPSFYSWNRTSAFSGTSVSRGMSLRAFSTRRTSAMDYVSDVTTRESRRRGNTNAFMVYQKLIRVPAPSVHRDCAIGSLAITTVSLVTLFNLALVYHLKAIHAAGTTNHSTLPAINKALQLYDVTYNALEKYRLEEKHQHESCLRFRATLCNNLSHVHMLAGDHESHVACLRELLSTIMTLTDYNARKSTDDTSGECSQSLEGFLANAAPLISSAQCANAA